MANSEILLQSGTNELGLLEFYIAGNSFGINVAKINSLERVEPVQKMPNCHPCIEGVFKPRDQVYTVIDLPAYLGFPPSETPDKDIFIIASFNQIDVAFHVDSVESIHRISWELIEKPDSIVYGGADGVVTGIVKIEDRICSILDFEKIVYDISPETGIQMSDIHDIEHRSRSDARILLAEDSNLLRKMIIEALVKSGYTNVISVSDGAEAWNMLSGIKESGESILDNVACLITDIEMPKMDGLRLSKLVKDDKELREIPIIVFSSLIDENMKLKCVEVGTDAQLSKPEIGRLIDVIDDLIC